MAYIDGFVAAVPKANKQLYIEHSRAAAERIKSWGATRVVENWGDDVPTGKQTDFYRAADAQEGEVPVFAWIEWPDRATCDEAARKMESEMEGQDMPDMPFDGMRMFWGGFTPVFDSRG